MAKKFRLKIVSQEQELISAQVNQVTAPAVEGMVTILSQHAPLITRLDYGELTYQQNEKTHSLVVSQGFLHVKPNNEVMVVVDTAKHIREISLKKAQQAMKDAQKTLEESKDKRELILAEASLKQAMWEIRLAQKSSLHN